MKKRKWWISAILCACAAWSITLLICTVGGILLENGSIPEKMDSVFGYTAISAGAAYCIFCRRRASEEQSKQRLLSEILYLGGMLVIHLCMGSATNMPEGITVISIAALLTLILNLKGERRKYGWKKGFQMNT